MSSTGRSPPADTIVWSWNFEVLELIQLFKVSHHVLTGMRTPSSSTGKNRSPPAAAGTPGSTPGSSTQDAAKTPATPAGAGRNASIVNRDLKEIPPRQAYPSANDIPVCRYIERDYSEIVKIIEQAVHEKCQKEKMTHETYEIWRAVSAKFLRYTFLEKQ